MLPEIFEEFQVVYVFLATFCFSLSLSIGKRSTLRKICSPPSSPPSPPPGFYGPEMNGSILNYFPFSSLDRMASKFGKVLLVCFYS